MNYKRNIQTDKRTVSCVQWTEAEQQLLMELQKQLGNNWAVMSANYFPERNANQLKCKFNYLSRKSAPTKQKPQLKQEHNSIDTSISSVRKQESSNMKDLEEGLRNMDDFSMCFDIFDFE